MCYAVIMAGGSGTRFWPWSRQQTPKQLLKITGKDTMIRQTVDRVVSEIPLENIYVVTASSQAESIKRELSMLPERNIISEPFGRNTAACIGLAATVIRKKDADAIMAVMTADHIIEPSDVFLRGLRCAEKFAMKTGVLVTFGIKPDTPSVNYGYIERSQEGESVDGFSVFDVKAFTEKPDRATAESFVQSGKYYWNSGIFVWSVSTILGGIEKYMPTLAAGLTRISAALDSSKETEVIRNEYEGFDSVSIDYGVMEKISNVKMIEADFTWDDVGSWLAVERLNGVDQQKNTVLGKYCGLDSTENIIVGDQERLIATVNVSDLIIVNTKDVTLVCDKKNAEDIKKLIDLLKEKGLNGYL
ncbi:MAG: mannose-1-phosphate guanylyltransferase [Candidatus Scalindua sp. AMX11]|nr:MAG: mannose-1-phosphate guanylyltransferase [Candidatus Scalindua sp.]NOG83943.1 mannose-1-phosphate guanylyltransferase [Planctomycetota bacterium]RZV88014.1 MAG: mannose-1-phosphate guanylyltransferase [Candidatus Scalindua sp. SCAELEC01]TDE64162.1 MAG: mannose-1-phosphate guanylyltransferase [Candidatus Scalindua sp. AMX11]